MECYRLHRPCAILVSQSELPIDAIWMLQPIGKAQTIAHIARAQALWSLVFDRVEDANFHIHKFMEDAFVPLTIRHDLGQIVVDYNEGKISPSPVVADFLAKRWAMFEAAGNSVVYLPEDSVFRIDRQIFNSETPWLQIRVLRGPGEAVMDEIGENRLHLPLIDFDRMDYSPQTH